MCFGSELGASILAKLLLLSVVPGHLIAKSCPSLLLVQKAQEISCPNFARLITIQKLHGR